MGWVKGQSGNPKGRPPRVINPNRFKLGNTAGLATRWKPGETGNPYGGRRSKLQAEYEAYSDRLFDPVMRNAAFDCLRAAVKKHEIWAVTKYFDLMAKALPQPVLEVSVTATSQQDMDAARKEYDEQLRFIEEQLDRYVATERADENSKLLESGEPGKPSL